MDNFNNIFSPPQLGNRDREHKKIILQTSAFMALIAGLVLGVTDALTGFAALSFALFLLAGVSAFSLWSVRQDRLMLPSFLIPLSALLVLTANLIYGGTLHEPESLVYAVVIVYASLLLGKRAALLFAGLSILSQTIVYISFSSGFVVDGLGPRLDFPRNIE